MGYKAIICTSEKFESLNETATAYVRSEFDSVIDTWCNKLIHKDGRIAFTVKDRILPILKGEEIVTLTSDWFPNEL